MGGIRELFHCIFIASLLLALLLNTSRSYTLLRIICLVSTQAFYSEIGSNGAAAVIYNDAFCNGCITKFCSYKLSIHKKTKIMQIRTKNVAIFIYLIFYHIEIVKLDHFMTLSLSYASTFL